MRSWWRRMRSCTRRREHGTVVEEPVEDRGATVVSLKISPQLAMPRLVARMIEPCS